MNLIELILEYFELIFYVAFFIAMFGIPFLRSLLRGKNKKTGKIIITVIGLVVLLLIAIPLFSSWVSESNNNPWDYARIVDVDYKAVVSDEKDGRVIITERITFDVHAASNSPDGLFWELWRDLPERYEDGLLVNYQVNSVKEIRPDGTPVPWEEATHLYMDGHEFYWEGGVTSSFEPYKWYHSEGPYDEYYNWECVIFYVNGLYRETITFEIEYEMRNASFRYADCSVLYLSMFSEDMVKYLQSFRGQILFPLDIMPREGNFSAYTAGTNSNSFPFNESKNESPGYYTFYFELDGSQLKFKPYNKYIEFALIAFGDDKHIFTEYAPANMYSDYDVLEGSKADQAEYEALPGRFLIVKLILLAVCIIGAALLIFYAVNTDKRNRRKYTFFKPSMEIEYYRDVPSDLDPSFAAQLVFCKHKSKLMPDDGYSAIILSLVRKGYIELDRIDVTKDWDDKNIKICVKHKPEKMPLYAPPQGNTAILGSVYNQAAAGGQPGQSMCQQSMYNADAQPVQQTVETNTNTVTEQEKPNLPPLTPTEEQFFNLILRHSMGTDITLNWLQTRVAEDYQYTTAFVSQIKSRTNWIGVNDGYVQNNDYQKPRNKQNNMAVFFYVMSVLLAVIANLITYSTRVDFAFGGFFILGFAFFGAAIWIDITAERYVLLTQFGEDEYAKWRGLYNFMNSMTMLSERTVVELPLWEKYLVYATAFGISEKVVKAMQVRCSEAMLNASPMLRNPYYRSRFFYHSSRSVGHTFASATRSATYASYSGGGSTGFGGGFGGGGRGGGGGGGGH